jgi:hypothetical protein
LSSKTLLVFIADKEEGLQFFLTDDLLDVIPFMERFVAIDIKYLMGSTKRFDGLEVEQQIV